MFRGTHCSGMYLRSLLLENIGPITSLRVPELLNGESPKPVIFVGANGSGKSLALAHIANFFLSARADLYEGSEMEKGKVFKYRSPLYIHSGSAYSYSHLDFGSGLELEEWQLSAPRKELEKRGFKPRQASWAQISDEEHSAFCPPRPPELRKKLKDGLEGHALLYFPPNRFEQPAWLNQRNLTYTARFEDLTNIEGYSNRRGIAWEMLAAVKDWLLGVVLDHMLYEHDLNPVVVGLPGTIVLPQTSEHKARMPKGGPNTVAFSCLSSIVSQVLRHGEDETCEISLGSKQARNVGVQFLKSGKVVRAIPNLFALSTGETGLLAIFGGLLRDFDMTGRPYASLADITGIVVIDEVDIHLHVDMQRQVLPRLLRLFPKVQFILSSHAPLFLLGMKEEFGANGFTVISMPDGERIDVEEFREFERAYDLFSTTSRFKSEMQQQFAAGHGPMLFTEGELDPIHIKTAWEKLYPGTAIPFVVQAPGISTKTGGKGNGARNLLSAIRLLVHLLPSGQKAAALFDHDHGGEPRFSELKGSNFVAHPIVSDCLQAATAEAYGLLLPAPPGRENLVAAPTAKFRLLEIEHYYPDSILDFYDLKADVLPGSGLFEIKNSKKKKLSEDIGSFPASDFEAFHVLFDQLRLIGFC